MCEHRNRDPDPTGSEPARTRGKGDDQAFEELVQPLRGELLAHCYRMLGSTHDAEDALQDAMLRAWRRLGTFDARGSLRGWLYKIATNTCLDVIGKRKRVLPQNNEPKTDPHKEGPGRPLVDTVWLEPFPDETLEIEDGYASPDARYEQRESVELAFVAAIQLLPPRQRATLILREVLGYSAKETAESLDSTTASVNSALQRARKTIDDHMPDESQQATLRTIGDDRMREIVEAYMDAMERGDVNQVAEMLTEDAAWSMPPMSTWFGGSDLPEFMRVGPLSGEWKWRNVAACGERSARLRRVLLERERGNASRLRAQRPDARGRPGARDHLFPQPLDRVRRPGVLPLLPQRAGRSAAPGVLLHPLRAAGPPRRRFRQRPLPISGALA